jgi:hypothetical protein
MENAVDLFPQPTFRVEGRVPAPRPARGRRLLKLAVSLGLLSYVFTLVDVGSMTAVLRNSRPWLLAAAVALYLAGQALSAIKWRMLSTAVGFREPQSRMLAYYFVGVFFNAFGLGTVGGDVVRALYLGRHGRRRALALQTVIADRVSGFWVLIAIALVALLLFRTYQLPSAFYWTSVVLATVILAGWRALPAAAARVLPAESAVFRTVTDDLAPYWNDYALLAQVGAVSAVFHLSQIAVLALLARAVDLSIPGSYYFVFGPVVNLLSALPISWNGLGVREGSTIYLLAHVGIDREPAVAFSLLWFFLVIVSGALGAVVYLTLRDLSETATDAGAE